MSKHTITFNPLSVSGVSNALNELNAYIAKVKKLETELPKALCELGEPIAQANFDSAPYDILLSGGWSNVKVDVKAEQYGNGWRVYAHAPGQGGDNVSPICFIEFGAGVWYNGSDAYLGTRPSGVVGIGEYGKGRGKQDAWAFGTKENKTWTQGTPASNAMYYTAEEMKRRIEEEARRILNDD